MILYRPRTIKNTRIHSISYRNQASTIGFKLQLNSFLRTTQTQGYQRWPIVRSVINTRRHPLREYSHLYATRYTTQRPVSKIGKQSSKK